MQVTDAAMRLASTAASARLTVTSDAIGPRG
jgi:hypothetical protein